MSNKRRGHDFNEVRTNSGGDRAPSIRDQVDQFKFPADKFVTVRIISPVFMYAGYWVQTKKKDGGKAKFYMPSPSYNPESQSFDSTVFDPFFEYSRNEKDVDREHRLVQVQKYGYCNAIIMHEEARRPERIPRPTEQELQTGFKEKDSDSWTPVKVLRLSSTMMEQIQGIAQTNIVTNRTTGETKAMSIAHPKFGMTIRIKHSPNKPAASQYQILPGDKLPLNERQMKYLTWDLSDLERPEPEDRIRESYDRWAEKMGITESGDDGFDDEHNPGRPVKKAVKKGVKKAARPQQQEDWGGEEGDGSEGWDEGGDEGGWDEPTPQRRPAKKGVKKVARQQEESWDEGSGEDGGWEESGDGTEDWSEEGDGTEDGSWDEGSGGTEGWEDEGSGGEGGDEGWDESGGEGGWEEDGSGDEGGWDEPPARPVKKAVKKGIKKAARQQEDWGDESGDDVPWDEGGDEGGWDEPPARPVKKAARPPQRPVKKGVKKTPQRRPQQDDWS